MLTAKLTDIFRDSACVEDAVAVEANTPTNSSFEAIPAGAPGAEVVVVRERRRRYSAQEKIEFVKLTYTARQFRFVDCSPVQHFPLVAFQMEAAVQG